MCVCFCRCCSRVYVHANVCVFMCGCVGVFSRVSVSVHLPRGILLIILRTSALLENWKFLFFRRNESLTKETGGSWPKNSIRQFRIASPKDKWNQIFMLCVQFLFQV